MTMVVVVVTTMMMMVAMTMTMMVMVAITMITIMMMTNMMMMDRYVDKQQMGRYHDSENTFSHRLIAFLNGLSCLVDNDAS